MGDPVNDTVEGKPMLYKLFAWWKAYCEISAALAHDTYTAFSEEQYPNAYDPTLVTVSGMPKPTRPV